MPDRAPSAERRTPRRVALVHDWLTGMRGGEKVLEAICELYPEAQLYSLIHVRGTVSAAIEGRGVRTSFAQGLPRAGRFYRQYLPLFPTAVELFDLDAYDLVISTSHCAVKSVIRPGRAVHVNYCHSPMRYAWDQFDEYFGPAQIGPTRSRLLRPVMAALARWDRATAGRVDRFVANSRYVAGRIRRYYNRGSTVVYPPVDTAFYRPADDHREPRFRFLVVSALVPYKRLPVAIEACRRLGAPLTIVGTGPELPRLQASAGPDVEFLGWLSDEEVRDRYRRSKAVLLPGVEDFGMVPVEAQACGCPVVALGQGGAEETVIDGETGVLVQDTSVEAFTDGLDRVRSQSFDRDALYQHALRFSREHFLTGFQAAVDEALQAPHDDTGVDCRPSAVGSRSRQSESAVAVDRRVGSRPSSEPAAREDDEAAARRTRAEQSAAREDHEAAARRARASQPAAREDQQ
jgi:glycosyltransferase involved in cell wall biosynthesis